MSDGVGTPIVDRNFFVVDNLDARVPEALEPFGTMDRNTANNLAIMLNSMIADSKEIPRFLVIRRDRYEVTRKVVDLIEAGNRLIKWARRFANGRIVSDSDETLSDETLVIRSVEKIQAREDIDSWYKATKR